MHEAVDGFFIFKEDYLPIGLPASLGAHGDLYHLRSTDHLSFFMECSSSCRSAYSYRTLAYIGEYDISGRVFKEILH